MITRANRPDRAICLVATSALCMALCSNSALAVILSSGNGNTDAATLSAAGGPGNPLLPGFGNIGRSSSGNASVTYLGSQWVLTAGHNAIGTVHGPVTFGGIGYTVDDSSITFLHNPDSSLTDLKLFRITADPGLPSIAASLLNSATPTGRQIMIGNGLSIGSQHFWHDDLLTNPWPADLTPGTVDADDYSGFDVTAPRAIRWGENNVLATGVLVFTVADVHAYLTKFDDLGYTGVAPLASEAQASTGDSGGGVFELVGGQWKLSGIILATDGSYSRQPPSTALFGNLTYIADLSVYRDEILAIVPEPGGFALAIMAMLGLLARRAKWLVVSG